MSFTIVDFTHKQKKESTKKCLWIYLPISLFIIYNKIKKIKLNYTVYIYSKNKNKRKTIKFKNLVKSHLKKQTKKQSMSTLWSDSSRLRLSFFHWDY